MHKDSMINWKQYLFINLDADDRLTLSIILTYQVFIIKLRIYMLGNLNHIPYFEPNVY